MPQRSAAGARQVEPAAAVQALREGETSTPSPPAAELPGPLAKPPEQERRQAVRRAEDRRREQVPVLVDTRVAQRRKSRRRRRDQRPSKIDVEA
jgi:hypothetical protein